MTIQWHFFLKENCHCTKWIVHFVASTEFGSQESSQWPCVCYVLWSDFVKTEPQGVLRWPISANTTNNSWNTKQCFGNTTQCFWNTTQYFWNTTQNYRKTRQNYRNTTQNYRNTTQNYQNTTQNHWNTITNAEFYVWLHNV